MVVTRTAPVSPGSGTAMSARTGQWGSIASCAGLAATATPQRRTAVGSVLVTGMVPAGSGTAMARQAAASARKTQEGHTVTTASLVTTETHGIMVHVTVSVWDESY